MFYSIRHSHWASLLLLLLLCWIVATASISGSIVKWNLRDDVPAFGIEHVLNDTEIKFSNKRPGDFPPLCRGMGCSTYMREQLK